MDTLRICQRRSPSNQYRYVREVKCGAWQSRIWIDGPGRGFSLNLGLSLLRENDNDRALTEWCASRKSKAFVKLWRGTRTIGSVVEELQGLGLVARRIKVPSHIACLTAMVPEPQSPPSSTTLTCTVGKPIARVPRGFVRWKIEGVGEARLLELARGVPPRGRTKWTAKLLADALVANGSFDSISDTSVVKALKRLMPAKIEGAARPSGKASPSFIADACEHLRQERLAALAAASPNLAV